MGTNLLSKRENAQRELDEITQQIESKQGEYKQIAKRVEVKHFELNALNQSAIEEEEEKENEIQTVNVNETKKEVVDSAVYHEELDATLKQLNAIKTELRNHQNYHKIIRLDAVETEIAERIKELSRLKNELQQARDGHCALHAKIAQTTQELKGMEHQINAKQNAINGKVSEMESVQTLLDQKKMELAHLNNKL